jgi:hypothetical protein
VNTALKAFSEGGPEDSGGFAVIDCVVCAGAALRSAKANSLARILVISFLSSVSVNVVINIGENFCDI